MTKNELEKVLTNHKLWLRGEGGERADLGWMDPRGMDIKEVDLEMASLRGARLTGSDLCGARLKNVDLSWASLDGVNYRLF